MARKKDSGRSKRRRSDSNSGTTGYGTPIQRSQSKPGQSGSYEPAGVIRTATDAAEDKVDEATTKTYRFTKSQLKDLVQSVETEKGLAEYLEHNDMDPASQIQDSASSTLGGAMKGWKAGSAVGSVAGPVGTLAGGVAGVPVGAFLANKFGKQAAGKIQGFIRDTLGLNTDQEFDTDEQTGSTRFD